MKLSPQTLHVLKNFASINTSIVFKPGHEIVTMSAASNIYAKCIIQEDIPIEFAVYDLNSLLAILTVFSGNASKQDEIPEIVFGEKSLNIITSKGSFEYFYTSLDVIKDPPRGDISFIKYASFKLTAEEIQTLLKAIAIVGAPSLTCRFKDGQGCLLISDRKNSTAPSFKRDVSINIEDAAADSFDVFLPVENLKILIQKPTDEYVITIGKSASGKSKFLHLKTDNLQYWLACDPQSVIS